MSKRRQMNTMNNNQTATNRDQLGLRRLRTFLKEAEEYIYQRTGNSASNWNSPARQRYANAVFNYYMYDDYGNTVPQNVWVRRINNEAPYAIINRNGNLSLRASQAGYSSTDTPRIRSLRERYLVMRGVSPLQAKIQSSTPRSRSSTPRTPIQQQNPQQVRGQQAISRIINRPPPSRTWYQTLTQSIDNLLGTNISRTRQVQSRIRALRERRQQQQQIQQRQRNIPTQEQQEDYDQLLGETRTQTPQEVSQERSRASYLQRIIRARQQSRQAQQQQRQTPTLQRSIRSQQQRQQAQQQLNQTSYLQRIIRARQQRRQAQSQAQQDRQQFPKDDYNQLFGDTQTTTDRDVKSSTTLQRIIRRRQQERRRNIIIDTPDGTGRQIVRHRNLIRLMNRQLFNSNQVVLSQSEQQAIVDYLQPERYNGHGSYDIQQDTTGVQVNPGLNNSMINQMTIYPRRTPSSIQWNTYDSMTTLVTRTLALINNLSPTSPALASLRTMNNNTVGLFNVRTIRMLIFNMYREFGFTIDNPIVYTENIPDYSFSLRFTNFSNTYVTSQYRFSRVAQQVRQVIHHLMENTNPNTYRQSTLNIRTQGVTTLNRDSTVSSQGTPSTTTIRMERIINSYTSNTRNQNLHDITRTGPITSGMMNMIEYFLQQSINNDGDNEDDGGESDQPRDFMGTLERLTGQSNDKQEDKKPKRSTVVLEPQAQGELGITATSDTRQGASEADDDEDDKLDASKELQEADRQLEVENHSSLRSVEFDTSATTEFEVGYLEGDIYYNNNKLDLDPLFMETLKCDITWCFPRSILAAIGNIRVYDTDSQQLIYKPANSLISDMDIFNIKYKRGSVFTLTSVTNEKNGKKIEIIPLGEKLHISIDLHQLNLFNVAKNSIYKITDNNTIIHQYNDINEYIKVNWKKANQAWSRYQYSDPQADRYKPYIGLAQNHAFPLYNDTTKRYYQVLFLLGLELYSSFGEYTIPINRYNKSCKELGQLLMSEYLIKLGKYDIRYKSKIHYIIPNATILAYDKQKSRELINELYRTKFNLDNVEVFTSEEPSSCEVTSYKETKVAATLQCAYDIETYNKKSIKSNIKDTTPYANAFNIDGEATVFHYSKNGCLINSFTEFLLRVFMKLNNVEVEESKRALGIIYAHNGGKFDHVICIQDIFKAMSFISKFKLEDGSMKRRNKPLNYEMNTCQMSPNQIINITINIYLIDRTIEIIFRDSCKMVSMSLADMSEKYGGLVVKAPFNHEFVTPEVIKNEFKYSFTRETLDQFLSTKKNEKTNKSQHDEYLDIMKHYDSYINNTLNEDVPPHIIRYYDALIKKTNRRKSDKNKDVILELYTYMKYYCMLDVDCLQVSFKNYRKSIKQQFDIDPIYINTQASLIKKLMLFNDNTLLSKYPAPTDQAAYLERDAIIGGQVTLTPKTEVGLTDKINPKVKIRPIKDEILIEKYHNKLKSVWETYNRTNDKVYAELEYTRIYNEMDKDGLLDGAVSTMDAVSLYPSAIILTDGLPAGNMSWLTNKQELEQYKKDLVKYSHPKHYILEEPVDDNHPDSVKPVDLINKRTCMRVVLKNTRKNPLISMIPINAGGDRVWAQDIGRLNPKTNKPIYSDNQRTMSLGDIMLRTIIHKHGLEPEDFEIKYALVYDTLDYSIAKFIKVLFKMRQQAKKDGNDQLQAAIKLMMNSAYGQMIMKPRDKSVEFCLKEKYNKSKHRRDVIDFQTIVDKTDENGNDDGSLGFLTKYSKITPYRKGNEGVYLQSSQHYGIGRCILDSSKAIMGKFHSLVEEYNEVNKVNEPIYYTDTDSFYIPTKCCRWIIEEDIKKTKRGEQPINKFSSGKKGEDKPGQVNCDFDGKPLIDKGTDKAIGAFSIASFFCSKKVKCCRVVSREGIKDTFTAKGVPKSKMNVQVYKDVLDGFQRTFEYSNFRPQIGKVQYITSTKSLR